MLKKSIIIFIVILSVCFSIYTLADSTVSFSDDLSKVDYNGVEYSRFSSSLLYTDVYSELYANVMLTEDQKETIHSVNLFTNDYKNIIKVTVTYKDGSVLSMKFIQNDYLEEYNGMISHTKGKSFVYFEWPTDNTVNVDLTTFRDADSTLDWDDLYSDYFRVFIDNADATIRVLAGALFIVEDEYYFVDFNNLSLTDGNKFNPQSYDELSAYKITDEVLKEELAVAYDEYYNDGTNFLLDEDFTKKLSKIFFIFLLGILPCALAIVYLILLMRSNDTYKKIYAFICVTALATSVLFTILFAIIMHYN